MKITKENIGAHYDKRSKSLAIDSHEKVVVEYIPHDCEEITTFTSVKIVFKIPIPNSVKEMDFEHTKISKLPTLPPKLRYLDTEGCEKLPEWQQVFCNDRKSVNEFRSQIQKRAIRKYIKKL